VGTVEALEADTPLSTWSRSAGFAVRNSANRFWASKTERQNVLKSMPSNAATRWFTAASPVTFSRRSAFGSSAASRSSWWPDWPRRRRPRTARHTWPCAEKRSSTWHWSSCWWISVRVSRSTLGVFP